MIVDSALYRHGNRVAPDGDPHDFAALRATAAREPGFVWVGLHEPTEDELSEVASVFGLHELAIEDAVKAHQRPKLERYDDNLFLVLKTLWYVDEEDAVETGEISIFLGHDFVVTVRHGRGSGLAAAREGLEGDTRVLEHGPAAVVYAVCDRVVDEYVEVVDELQVDVDEVEASVFSEERTDDSARIYRLKREISEVRRAVLPLREPMSRFAAGQVPEVDAAAAPFFRDVLDHLARTERESGDLSTALTRLARTIPADAHVAVITPLLDAQAAASLKLLTARGRSVIVAALMWTDDAVDTLGTASTLGVQVVEIGPNTPLTRAFAHGVGAGA